MKIKVHEVNQNSVMECGLNNIKLDVLSKYIVGIDAATNHSGICIFNTTKRVPAYVVNADSDVDKYKGNRSVREFVRYKLEFKQLMKNILINNRQIEHVVYEEPIINQPVAVAPLFGLAPTIEEIIVEEEEVLGNLSFEFVSNKTWKKVLLGSKMPARSNSEAEKKAVKAYLVEVNERFDIFSEDATDSIGIAYAKDKELHGECRDIKVQKKQTAFEYNAYFFGEDVDDFEEAMDIYTQLDEIPKVVRANGYKLVEMYKTDDFDQLIYNSMDGLDIPLIVKTESKFRGMGKIILRHSLVEEKKHKYIYAIIWRKRRK